MDDLELGARLSALIFSQARPVSVEQLSRTAGIDEAQVQGVIENLRALFKEEVHGFSLEEVSGGFQFRTSPKASEAIKRLAPQKAKRLSRAALETLSVIAYKQPVQRAEIEAIRGVDALPTLKTLLEVKLIRTLGHDESVGQPSLYGTTERFLERFGMRNLEDLPSLRELEEVLDDPGEASEESPDESTNESTEPSAGHGRPA